MNYLQKKLKEVKQKDGKNSFYSFYRDFLLQLFHQGLGQPQKIRSLTVVIGNIPYLDGGLFDVHVLERQFETIKIKDDAFEKIFNFFDRWNWHLDTNVEATGRDINPDVIGYIFEKYINDRSAMGAYYTKEDITDYIGKNTIIPFLFDKVKREYPKAFKDNGYLWVYLRNSGDAYIYEAVKKGVYDTANGNSPQKIEELAIPENIAIGLDTQKPELLERRKAWNNKTPEEYALPTEIWRETIGRWKRYFEVKEKITSGEIIGINDFITYNLNIRQFIQDILENTDDPDLIRHFYKALHSITILDPTCGSGAFLFAALNILEPLYEACIERMEQFTSEAPRKYKFFHEVLAEVNSEEHPNLRYYIYKTIILNNLYGVDIMHEAVEIAKLRLFLKMVGAVDMNLRKPNFGLEPLPDIDFNIRAGNTLVGFVTEKELKNAIQYDEQGYVRMDFGDNTLDKFKEECQIVATAFKHFQDAQLITDKGEDTHKKAKAELQNRLVNLNEKLNVYLASTYEIDKNKFSNEKKFKIKYQEWYSSHQPFHWFAEFYEIINGNGGFDVVIGNPPYVEYKDAKKDYELKDYKTIDANNLFAYTYERAVALSHPSGHIGLIIPVASVCTDRYTALQKIWLLSGNLIISNFNDRPGKLFEGLEHIRLSIVILRKTGEETKTLHLSQYNKWHTIAREFLFHTLSYSEASALVSSGSIPKIGTEVSKVILAKLKRHKKVIAYFSTKHGTGKIFYTRKLSGFVQILDFIPKIQDKNGKERIPSELKNIFFEDSQISNTILATLNSSLFYWFLTIWSDCRNLNKREVLGFPISDSLLADRKLSSVATTLMVDLSSNSRILQMGQLRIQCIYPKLSKPLIDEIDNIIAQHYGFTEEELDFIINYDIKYRMGKVLFEEDEAETGDE